MATDERSTVALLALDLPPAERVQLAALLFDSVADENPELWPKSLVTELRGRSHELASGQVHGLTSEEVFGEALTA